MTLSFDQRRELLGAHRPALVKTHLLVLRAVAMFMMAAHGLAFVIVPLMAVLLSYFEIWPGRALGAVFGDPSRLHEYDPGGD